MQNPEVKTLHESIAPSPFTALLRAQRPNGAWAGEVELNPGPTAQAALLWRAIGREFPAALAPKAKHYILRSQNADGGWSPHAGAPSEISLSIECYVALRVLGETSHDEATARARHFILAHGGAARANPWTQLYLGVLGIIPWKAVQKVPLEFALLPRIIPLSLQNFAYWVKVISLPMSLLGAVGPGPAIPEANEIAGELEISRADFSVADKNPLIKWLRKAATKAAELAIPFLREQMIARALRRIDEFTETHGDFGGNTCTALNVLLALHRRGDQDTERFKRGLSVMMNYAVETETEWRLQCCQSHVWDTGFALGALEPSAATGAAIARGVQWLKQNQILDTKGDWAHNVSAEPGGWCFGDRHRHFPVTDCTALALVALVRHEPAFAKTPEALRAVKWLCEMQHSSGGWSAYEKYSQPSFARFFQFKDIPGGLLDVPKADVTAKVVQGLFPWIDSEPGVHAALEKARAFLLGKRESNGLWRGNYGVNYIYGTWLAAKALALLDRDANAEWAVVCRKFFVDHQNSDGGWGEVEESYRNPQLAGCGRSSIVQTAWAIMGLCAVADEAEKTHDAIKKGCEYLTVRRDPTGAWTDPGYWGTVFPEMVYFRYQYYPLYFPLMALQAAGQRGGAR